MQVVRILRFSSFTLALLTLAGCSVIVDPGQYESAPVFADAGSDAVVPPTDGGADGFVPDAPVETDAGCTETQCAADGLFCDPTTRRCVGCVDDEQCDNDARPICRAGVCVGPIPTECAPCEGCAFGEDGCPCDDDDDGFLSDAYSECARDLGYPETTDCDDNQSMFNPVMPAPLCGSGTPASCPHYTNYVITDTWDNNWGAFPPLPVDPDVPPGRTDQRELHDDVQLHVGRDGSGWLLYRDDEDEPTLARVTFPTVMGGRPATQSVGIQSMLPEFPSGATIHSACLGLKDDHPVVGVVASDGNDRRSWIAEFSNTPSVQSVQMFRDSGVEPESVCVIGDVDGTPTMAFTQVRQNGSLTRDDVELVLVDLASSSEKSVPLLDGVTGPNSRTLHRAIAMERDLVVVADYPNNLLYFDIDRTTVAGPDVHASGIVRGDAAGISTPELGAPHRLFSRSASQIVMMASHNDNEQTLILTFELSSRSEWEPLGEGMERDWVMHGTSTLTTTLGSLGTRPVIVQVDEEADRDGDDAVLMTLRNSTTEDPPKGWVFSRADLEASSMGTPMWGDITAVAADSALVSGDLEVWVAATIHRSLYVRVLRFCNAN